MRAARMIAYFQSQTLVTDEVEKLTSANAKCWNSSQGYSNRDCRSSFRQRAGDSLALTHIYQKLTSNPHPGVTKFGNLNRAVKKLSFVQLGRATYWRVSFLVRQPHSLIFSFSTLSRLAMNGCEHFPRLLSAASPHFCCPPRRAAIAVI